MNETPILLLTGYLGSGKTTLVNNILTNKKGIKFAVIVNDIGEINIDAALIQKGGVVDQKDDSLVALQNGCICCSLQFDLVEQLSDIVKSGKFDYIVIEASGICEPEPIARTIASIPNMDEKYSIHGLPKLDCIVTVVDALRMKSEFECGNKLDKNVLEEEDIANLVIQQIEFCNIVLLNKASEVSREDLNRIKAIINNLQPGVEIIECDYTNIDLEKIINTNKFEYYKIAAAAGWIRHIETPSHQDMMMIIITNMSTNMNMSTTIMMVRNVMMRIALVIITIITDTVTETNMASVHLYITDVSRSTQISLTDS